MRISEFTSTLKGQWYRCGSRIVNLKGIRVTEWSVAGFDTTALQVEFVAGYEVQGMHELLVLLEDLDVGRGSLEIDATIQIGGGF